MFLKVSRGVVLLLIVIVLGGCRPSEKIISPEEKPGLKINSAYLKVSGEEISDNDYVLMNSQEDTLVIDYSVDFPGGSIVFTSMLSRSETPFPSPQIKVPIEITIYKNGEEVYKNTKDLSSKVFRGRLSIPINPGVVRIKIEVSGIDREILKGKGNWKDIYETVSGSIQFASVYIEEPQISSDTLKCDSSYQILAQVSGKYDDKLISGDYIQDGVLTVPHNYKGVLNTTVSIEVFYKGKKLEKKFDIVKPVTCIVPPPPPPPCPELHYTVEVWQRFIKHGHEKWFPAERVNNRFRVIPGIATMARITSEPQCWRVWIPRRERVFYVNSSGERTFRAICRRRCTGRRKTIRVSFEVRDWEVLLDYFYHDGMIINIPAGRSFTLRAIRPYEVEITNLDTHETQTIRLEQGRIDSYSLQSGRYRVLINPLGYRR